MELYSKVYEAYLKEKNSSELEELDETIFEGVSEKLSLDSTDKKIRTEQENLRKLLENIRA